MRRAGGIQPPWIWLFFALYLGWGLPDQIDVMRGWLDAFSGDGLYAPLVGHTSLLLLRLFVVVELLPIVLLVGGVLSVAFPGLRARRVERKLELRPADDRPVLVEMQHFVNNYAPGTQLYMCVNAKRLARTYPVGWRRARIAIFLPMIRLWREDRPAAQAVLLHEMAHIRQGDHLVVGLGSPFLLLLWISAPAFILLGLLPILIYFVIAPHALATVVSAQVVLESTHPIRVLVLPVVALWLSELSADRLPAQILGPEALQRGLARGKNPKLRALLSHPPLTLRRWASTPGPLGTAVLLTAWPSAIVVSLLIALATAAPTYLLIGTSPANTVNALFKGTHIFLMDARLTTAAITATLLAWPHLVHTWTRRWLPDAPSLPSDTPHIYRAAAILPIALLLASFIPPPTL